MILLLGGTSETAPVAEALARAGYRVLVSTATGIDLFVGSHPRIEHRRGRLDAKQMAELVKERGIRAMVDASHPFASAVRAAAPQVAEQLQIPYVSYARPGCVGEGEGEGICIEASHEEAARRACEPGLPILLTIGSRNVLPYALEARRAGVPLVARVLDHPDSLQACREAGIPEDCILTGRGPFSVEENRSVIQKYKIGVLATKDSGSAGGVPEKLEAARQEGCRVIVVGRPDVGDGFCGVADLVQALESRVPPPPCGVLALDLESVLVPEIWESVARIAGAPELALTTRDFPDYDALMGRRLVLCREHGLTL